jgi:hypothetical protein
MKERPASEYRSWMWQLPLLRDGTNQFPGGSCSQRSPAPLHGALLSQLSADTRQQGLRPAIDTAAYRPRFAVYGATCAELVEVHGRNAPSVFVE